jgi:hypothetical protein
VAILHHGPRRSTLAGERTPGWVERVLFYKGRLIAVGDYGLTVIEHDAADSPRVVWPPERDLVDESPVH